MSNKKKTIRVVPVDGAKFPIMGNPRRYIKGETEVPEIGYYVRGIQRGSLELAPESKPTKKAAQKKSTPEKEQEN